MSFNVVNKTTGATTQIAGNADDRGIGNLNSLTTTNKSSLVSAINEVNAESNNVFKGTMSDWNQLDTEEKIEYDYAIISNDFNPAAIGNLSSLHTTDQSSIVGAINEVTDTKQNIADNSLNTTSKTIPGAINELKSSLMGRAKVCGINVPEEKLDVRGFLNHILGTIIEEQEIGSYVVEGAWINHDYYTGIVYKVSSDTAIGMIEYGIEYSSADQKLALYSACYKVGIYSNYRAAQLERDLVAIPVGSTVAETNRNGEYELMSAIQINSNVSVCGNIKAYFSSGKWFIQTDTPVATNNASICCVFRHV